MQIQIDRNGERYGPYSIEDVNSYLANGTLLPSDNAWHDGMPDWVPIRQIQGVILPGGDASPQQPTPAVEGVDRLQSEATAPQGGKRTLWILLGAVAVVCLAVGGYFIFSSDQPDDEKDDKSGAEKSASGASGSAVSGDWGSRFGRSAKLAVALKSKRNIGSLGLGGGINDYRQDHRDKVPTAEKWCDDIFDHLNVKSGKYFISPQAPNAKKLNPEDKHCHYAMNAAVAGKTVPGRVVVLFECDLGWNGSGGLEDAKQFAKDRDAMFLAVYFADYSSDVVEPKELDGLQWTP